MKWENTKKTEDGRPAIPFSWLHVHYFEAMNILFRVENSLRVFVFVILKNTFQEDWINTSISDADGSIASIFKKRIYQINSYAYLGVKVTCPIMYLTIGELLNIITKDKLWPLFKDYFLGSKVVMGNKLDEISYIRNSFAHFRPVKQDDIEVIKQNSNHTLCLIEKCLSEVFSQNETVPTNTDEAWYKALRTVGNESCNLHFYQSNNEKWISIDLKFLLDVINKREGFRLRRFMITNIKTPSILKEFKNLKKHAIYITETVPTTYVEKDQDPIFYKKVKIVFSRECLQSNQEIIKDNLEELLILVNEESDLIINDNLAKGKIVDTSLASTRLSSERNKSLCDLDNLKCDVKENDPPEYWGQFSGILENFISETDEFPWIPITVSECVPF